MLRLFDAHCHLQVSKCIMRCYECLNNYLLSFWRPFEHCAVFLMSPTKLHLQDARFGSSVGKIIQEAQEKGVQRLACNGCCEGDWEKVWGLTFHLHVC